MYNFKRFFLVSFLILNLFCFGIAVASANEVDAPTIDEVDASSSKHKPQISGMSQNGTYVHFYVDGVYNGNTDLIIGELDEENFSYQPFLNLSSGQHVVWAVAENEAGIISKVSNVYKFEIEPGVPAPTLFQPVVNAKNVAYPIVVGLSKNDLKIKVFIDDKLDGEFIVENHESGTASFSYQADRALARGEHSVYAIAVDNQEEESQKSNSINFNITEPLIGDSADEEISDKKDEEIPSEEISKLIQEGLEEKKFEEDSEKDDGLSPSAIIFILFFIGIIGWIIWVNRELIKEKRDELSDKSGEDDRSQ